MTEFIEWGVAARPFPGELVSGDLSVVRLFPGGALVAVVDGLGHGRGAYAAAKVAEATIESYAHEPLDVIFKRCHEELRKTRGVVMSLASFAARSGTMTWMGVGNVEGVLVRVETNGSLARESVALRGGVVGFRLPTLRASVSAVTRGDTLVLTTDGVRQGFTDEAILRDSPQQTADRLLAQHAKETDDALVLVARYLGVGR